MKFEPAPELSFMVMFSREMIVFNPAKALGRVYRMQIIRFSRKNSQI